MQFFVFGKHDQHNPLVNLPPDELDNLSYGAVLVDAKGKILMFNEMEAQITGIPKNAAKGKNFFTDVAPCTDVAGFRGRFDAGVQSGRLDAVFEWHLNGETYPTVQVHLKNSQTPGNYWIFVKRL